MAEPLQAIEAEVASEPAGVEVPLVTDDGTVDILVPHPSMWFEGAVEALTAGRTAEWVSLALDGDELAKWQSARKRYRDIDAFITEWMSRSGNEPGKSLASKPSSRSKRRR